MSDKARRHVVELELQLLDPATRADAQRLDELLDDEFVEIGASGRTWNRTETITSIMRVPSVPGLSVSDMSARQVTSDVVVVTYQTTTATRAALRSSWWHMTDSGWRIFFHQGTPAG